MGGGAETHSSQLKLTWSLLKEHAGLTKTSRARRSVPPGHRQSLLWDGSRNRAWGPEASQPSLPRLLQERLSLSALIPRLSLRPPFFSFLCSASHGVLALPQIVLPSGRRMEATVPVSRRPHSEKEELPLRALLSRNAQCLPGMPTVHWQKWVTHPLLKQPLGASRTVANRPIPFLSVFPHAHSTAWSSPPSSRACLPSPLTCLYLQRVTRAFQED